MRHSASQFLRVAVLGSTGATGRHVVATALDRGHEVTALVRRPQSFVATTRLRELAWRDVGDVDALAAAFEVCDVVISALGGAPKGPTNVCTDGIRSVVAAMSRVRMARLLVVSAYGVADGRDGSLYSRAAWAFVAERMRDKERMEALVTGSGLDWTIVRPPALDDRRASGGYRVGVDLPIRLWSAVSRADLAAFLLDEAEAPRFVRCFPRIAR